MLRAIAGQLNVYLEAQPLNGTAPPIKTSDRTPSLKDQATTFLSHSAVHGHMIPVYWVAIVPSSFTPEA
jgi:hypothetical protein